MQSHTTKSVPSNIKALLDEHALKIIYHPAGSTATALLAAEQLGVAVGQIANTLLWKKQADSQLLLLIVSGDKKVSNGKMKRLVGGKVRLATASEIYDALGLYPGSVSPFAISTIPIYIDTTLQRYDTIYPAAGTDCSSVQITYRRLIEIVHAIPADIVQETE